MSTDTRLTALQLLLQSDGWALLKQRLEEDRDNLFMLLERSNDPTSLAKNAGSLCTTEALLRLPDRMIAALTQPDVE